MDLYNLYGFKKQTMNSTIKTIYLLSLITLFTACNKEETDDTTYNIPASYTEFENVSYTGQTERLSMMNELTTYMKESRTANISLSANKLKAMFANETDAAFAQAYEKNIKSKTFENVQTAFENLMDELATASNSTTEGSNGVSGVIVSTVDHEDQYLIGDDGLDHAQLIEKGLMGACFYYQATAVYFGDDKMNADNTIINEGEGTDMEHHWDEAFGYFGVPTDFPTSTDGLSFWGNYANNRNAVLGCNTEMMDAFRKGRAAITNKDLPTRDEAITEARTTWEKIAVGSALHYLNDGTTTEIFEDMAQRGHLVSEAIGFIYALQFNHDKTITNTQINELLEIIAGSPNFSEMNLYNTTIPKLQEAKDKLADYYNLTDIKDEF